VSTSEGPNAIRLKPQVNFTRPFTLDVFGSKFYSVNGKREENFIRIDDPGNTTANISFNSFDVAADVDHDSPNDIMYSISTGGDLSVAPNTQISAKHNWFGTETGPISCCTFSGAKMYIGLGIDFSTWSLVRIVLSLRS